MKEKLVIKNFGPIKDAEFEFSRFNVLIGEQATGKSTVAKLLAVCRYFSYILGEDSFPDPFENGLSAWGLEESIKEDTYIFYENQHYLFTAKRGNFGPLLNDEDSEDYWAFAINLEPKSNGFKNLLLELKNIKPIPQSNYDIAAFTWSIPVSFYQNNVSNIMDNPFYLPTERGLQSIFSLGKNSIPNISDSLFNQFARLDQISRFFKNETDIEPLDIVYKNINGKGYIKKKTDDRFYSLYNSASGFQSTIPLILVVKYYSELRKKEKTFIIEEPELNLYPTAQNKLMQFLVDNARKHFGNKIFLTTHSPYILGSINNMMYAYQVGKHNEEEVDKIIKKEYWLNPHEISAYRLLSNGTYRNILDEELKQINVGELDEVSRSINEDWDRIASVEFGAGDDQFK